MVGIEGNDARSLLSEPARSGTSVQLSASPPRWLFLHDEYGKGWITLIEGIMLTADVAFEDGAEWRGSTVDQVENVQFPGQGEAYLISVSADRSTKHATLLLTFAEGALDIKLAVKTARQNVSVFQSPFRVIVREQGGAEVSYQLPTQNSTKMKRVN